MKYILTLFIMYMALKMLFRKLRPKPAPAPEGGITAAPEDAREKRTDDTSRSSKDLFASAEILLDGMSEDAPPSEQETAIRDACDLYAQALLRSEKDSAISAAEITEGWAASLGYALTGVNDGQVLALGLGHMNRLYARMLKERPEEPELLAEWGEALLLIASNLEGHMRYTLLDEACNKFSMGAAFRPSAQDPRRKYEALAFVAASIDSALEEFPIEEEADVPWKLRFLKLAQSCYTRAPQEYLDDGDKEILSAVREEMERLHADYPHMAGTGPTVPQPVGRPSGRGWAELEKKPAPGTAPAAPGLPGTNPAASSALREKSAAARAETQTPPVPERRQGVIWPPEPSEQSTPTARARIQPQKAQEQTAASPGSERPLAAAEPAIQESAASPAAGTKADGPAAYSRVTLPTHHINGQDETTTYPQRQPKADRPLVARSGATLSASASTDPRAMAPQESGEATTARPQQSRDASTARPLRTAPAAQAAAPSAPAPAQPRQHALRQPDHARREQPDQGRHSAPPPSFPAGYVPMERKPLPRQ